MLPTTKSLCALEATVRLGTATLAAAELHVTQTAVSHRLRDLEEQLGQPLFTRHGRRLEPTTAALQLAEAVRNSSSILDAVWAGIQNKTHADELTISMLPALASKWLAPRLSEMMTEVQGANIRITASREFVDFDTGEVSAAIRYGTGNWPQVRIRPMASETVAPVMAPELANRVDLTSRQALSDVTHLRCDNPDSWEDWFAATGYHQPANPNEIFFDEDATMIEAAIAGHGVALGRFALVAHDLRVGRLVAPFDYRMTSKFSYWFVQGLQQCETQPVLDFFHWAKDHLLRDCQNLGETE